MKLKSYFISAETVFKKFGNMTIVKACYFFPNVCVKLTNNAIETMQLEIQKQVEKDHLCQVEGRPFIVLIQEVEND